MKIQQKSPFYTYSNKNFPHFAGKINLDSINADLSEIRKNDFISGVYYNDMFTIENNLYKKERIERYLHDINFIEADTKLFTGSSNDAACKMAAIEKHLDLHNQNTLIINKYPRIFDGISIDKIVNSLDTLSYEIRNNYEKYKSNDNYFTVDDKNINFKYAGKGCNSIVLKLSDNEGNKNAMKVYIKPEEVGAYSIWGELAVYHDLKDLHINNIPELYIANPLIKQVEDKNKFPSDIYTDPSLFNFDIPDTTNDTIQFKDYDGYKGGWTIVEYIDENSKPKPDGISLQQWLKQNNLFHMDLYSADNIKSGYIIDLGGIGN